MIVSGHPRQNKAAFFLLSTKNQTFSYSFNILPDCPDNPSQCNPAPVDTRGEMRMTATLDFPPPGELTFPAPHPLRRRLWKFAIAAAAVLLVLIVSDVNARLRNPSHKLELGHDLLPSYAAGELVRKGSAAFDV